MTGHVRLHQALLHSPPVTNKPADTPGLERLFNVDQVADALGVRPETVRDYVKTGQLAAVKVGLSPRAPVRVRAADVEKLLIPFVPRSADDPTVAGSAPTGSSLDGSHGRLTHNCTKQDVPITPGGDIS